MADIFTKEFLEEVANRAADILEERIEKREFQNKIEITERTYTAREVASLTKIDVQTIRTHAKLGLITGVKTGQRWTFTKESLNKYIGKNE